MISPLRLAVPVSHTTAALIIAVGGDGVGLRLSHDADRARRWPVRGRADEHPTSTPRIPT